MSVFKKSLAFVMVAVISLTIVTSTSTYATNVNPTSFENVAVMSANTLSQTVIITTRNIDVRTGAFIGPLPKLDNARFAWQFPARQGSADAAYPLGTQGGADAGLREIDRKAGVG